MCFERFYCWRRKSPLKANQSLIDKKFILENGFQVEKRRISGDVSLNYRGTPTNSVDLWDITNPYIVLQQIVDAEDKNEYGTTEYEGKDKIVFLTHPDYDVKVEDLILWDDKVFKVIKTMSNTHDRELPTLVKVTATKTNTSARYIN